MKKTEPNEALVTKITNTAAGIFPSFGGGRVSDNNPIAHALKDAQAMFAAGVDISAVVRLTLIMSAQPDLLAACEKAQFVYDYAICRTPTGPERNELTERNILRMQAIAKAKPQD